MNSSVKPAVTTPSGTPARSVARLNVEGPGRTTRSRTTPAQKSRSHAVPTAPTWSIRPTEAARPSWTQSMDTTAIEAPVRAGERVVARNMVPVNAVGSFAST